MTVVLPGTFGLACRTIALPGTLLVEGVAGAG